VVDLLLTLVAGRLAAELSLRVALQIFPDTELTHIGSKDKSMKGRQAKIAALLAGAQPGIYSS
jgi:hypothetical protein